ncbi:MAG: hypothetical protein Q8O05_04010 [Chloroflexota bacterium]|nr:hypothetical protein [Chloroflexota bacterium]
MEKTWKPGVAGLIDIISGVLWIIGAAFLSMVVLGFMVVFGPGEAEQAFWLTLAGISLPGILAIAGGICSLRRRNWLLAMVGAVCVTPLGAGIAALILTVRSKDEFS